MQQFTFCRRENIETAARINIPFVKKIPDDSRSRRCNTSLGEQKITLKKKVAKGWRGETAGPGCFTAVELSRGHKAETTGSKTMRGDDVDRVRFFLSRGRVTFLECLLAKARLSRQNQRARERERAQRRKEEKGGNGHTSLEHRRGERKSMVPVKVPEVLQTGEEVDDACLRYSALNLNNRLIFHFLDFK